MILDRQNNLLCPVSSYSNSELSSNLKSFKGIDDFNESNNYPEATD